MFKLVAAVLLTGLMVLPGGQALASGPTRERVYFECGDSRLANLDSAPAGWSTAVPAASVAEGSGCGQADIAGYSNSLGPVGLTTGRFAGTFTGNLESMNLRLDTISVGPAQAGGSVVFDVNLLIDGRNALSGTRRLEVQPIAAAGTNGRVHTYFFSVVALPYMDVVDDRLHSVELTVEPVNHPAASWIYGAKEVPSGIEFNPTGFHPYKIQPNE